MLVIVAVIAASGSTNCGKWRTVGLMWIWSWVVEEESMVILHGSSETIKTPHLQLPSFNGRIIAILVYIILTYATYGLLNFWMRGGSISYKTKFSISFYGHINPSVGYVICTYLDGCGAPLFSVVYSFLSGGKDKKRKVKHQVVLECRFQRQSFVTDIFLCAELVL